MHHREERSVGVSQHTLVVEDYRNFLNWAASRDFPACCINAGLTSANREVAAAEEEAVHRVGGVSGGKAEETVGAGGVGREGREDRVEVALVSGVRSKSSGVWAVMVDIGGLRCSEAEQRKKEGKKKEKNGRIQRCHFKLC